MAKLTHQMAYYDKYISDTIIGDTTTLAFKRLNGEMHEITYKTDNTGEAQRARYNMRAFVARTFAANKAITVQPDSHYEKYIHDGSDGKGQYLQFGANGKKHYYQSESMPDAPPIESVKQILIGELRVKFEKKNFDRSLGLTA